MSDLKIIPINFSVTINANVETVWHKMLDLETYKIWTAEFDPTSSYEGSWDLGQNISFKSTDGSGLAGKITENEYLKVVTITYESWLIKDGVIDESEESKAMKGTIERYTFTKVSEGITKLDVYGETLPSFSEYMKTQWPKALQKLKEICEVV